jgi:hypothetical protein
MSMTTDLTGGGFGPNKAELAAAAQTAAANARAESLVEAARAREDAMNPGKLPGMPMGKFASGGGSGGAPGKGGGGAPGVAQQHLATAVARGTELGEPTSFRGGAGAPEPIAVMRGTTTTYNAGQAGHQFSDAEYATPLQAQQAYNRSMLQQNLSDVAARSDREGLTRPDLTEAAEARYGGYRAPGQTGQEIAATKEGPGATIERTGRGNYADALADQINKTNAPADGKQHVGDFQRLMAESPYSTYKDGKMLFVPKDENQARDAMAAENFARDQGGGAGRQHFEERQQAREYFLTQPLSRGFKANDFLDKASSDPATWRAFMTKVNTANQAAMVKRQQNEVERQQNEKELEQAVNAYQLVP